MGIDGRYGGPLALFLRQMLIFSAAFAMHITPYKHELSGLLLLLSGTVFTSMFSRPDSVDVSIAIEYVSQAIEA